VKFPCQWEPRVCQERAFPGEIELSGADGQDELAATERLVLSLPLVSFPSPLHRCPHTSLEGGSETDEG